MSDEVIKISLVGEDAGLATSMQSAIQQLGNLKQSATNVQGSLSTLTSSVKTFSSSLGNIVSTDSFSKLNANIQQAKNNLSSFSVKPLQIPVEVGKINLPTTTIPPVTIPVDIPQTAAEHISLLSDLLVQLRRDEIAAKEASIVNETDVAKIAILKDEIAALEVQITRIKNVGSLGLTEEIGKDISLVEDLKARMAGIQLKINAANTLPEIAALNAELEKLKAEEIAVGNAGKTGFDSLGRSMIAQEGLLQRLQRQAKIYQTGIQQATLPENIAKYNAKLEATNIEIGKLSNAGKKGFNELGESVKKTGSSLGQAFSGLRTIANILPGIGIGTLVGFAIEPIQNFVQGLLGASATTEKFKEKLAELQGITTDSLLEGGSGEFTKAVENVESLRTHIDLAKQGLISKSAVVKEYNKTIGETTGKVNSLDEAEKGLAKNADAYIKFTLLKAAANAALGKAADAALAAEEARIKKVDDSAVKKIQSVKNPEINAADNKAANERIAENINKGNIKIEAGARKFDDEKSKFVNIAKDFTTQAALISKDFKFDFLGGQFADKEGKPQFDFFDKFFDVKPAKDKLEKQIKEMADAARAFAKTNFKIFEGLSPIISAPDEAGVIAAGKKFWADYQKGIVKLKPPKIDVGEIEIGLPDVKTPPITAIDLSTVFAPTEKFSFEPKIDITLDKEHILDKFKADFAALGRELPNKIGVLDPITGKEQVVKISTVFNTADLERGLTNAKKATVKQIEDFNSVLNDAGKGISVQGFSDIGKAIGSALSGSGIGSAFQDFGAFLGDAIQKLGEKMISLSPILVAINLAIKSFNPALLLPAGIALTALGGVIKSAFANSLPGHADGLDYVPYDNYVARLHRGEMVLTAREAARYNGAASAGGGGFNDTTYITQTLSGNDIQLLIKRVGRSQGRTT